MEQGWQRGGALLAWAAELKERLTARDPEPTLDHYVRTAIQDGDKCEAMT